MLMQLIKILVLGLMMLFWLAVGDTAVSPAFALTPTPSPNPPTPIPPPSAPTETDGRFGAVETYQAPGEASNAGLGWTRVRFQWADVQADGPDSWQAPVTNSQLNRELSDGREVVGLLIGIPAWARDERNLPQGLYLAPDDPSNLWANFVRTAVSQYDGQINHWIIWNEPDIWDETALGHTWDGTLEDFYQLQKVAYLVAKETNPEAVIHLAAFTYFWDSLHGREQYFARLLDLMLADPTAAENNYYFDIATAHLYFQPSVIYDLLLEFQQMMSDRGIEKPIWLVETNAPPANDPSWEVEDWTFYVTQSEQANFIPQVLAVALAAGAERIAIYKMRDLPTDKLANPEPFGLLRENGSRRPAFNALMTATRYMSGVNTAVRLRWDEIGVIQLNQEEQTTTLMFTRLPGQQTIVIPATADRAVLVDVVGNRRTILANEDKTYVIDLPGALCSQPAGDYCMIGGQPSYLVQRLDPTYAPATPTPTATATATPLPTETPPPATSTPLPSPTASPTATATATPTPTITNTPSPTATPIPLPPAATQEGFVFPSGLVLMGLAGLLLFTAVLWYLPRRP
jgi:hypothetical protein